MKNKLISLVAVLAMIMAIVPFASYADSDDTDPSKDDIFTTTSSSTTENSDENTTDITTTTQVQSTTKSTSPTTVSTKATTIKTTNKVTVPNTESTTVAKPIVKVPSFKLIKGKKQFKVNYKKVTGAAGFQVRYRIKGKRKVKTFKTSKNAVKVIKNLKKGTYNVQIRAFTKSKIYSKWSKTKKVKVK